MQLAEGRHLAYCTNIHRGETWAEVFGNLERHTLAVRDRVSPDRPYAIGLRLGAMAARELRDPGVLEDFRRWLERERCYVFTINGFPYGRFHGARVKEQVYAPDWTTPERLDYTLQLFEILERLLPPGLEGGVSTVPGSFKAFIRSEAQVNAMIDNLWRCVDELARVRERTGICLHLDLEPEPLCFLETTVETVEFFDRVRARRPDARQLDDHLRLNYDACHLAVEFEEPREAVARLRAGGVRIGKLHLSAALKTRPTPDARAALAGFADPVYFHQVVARRPDGGISRHQDLPEALAAPSEGKSDAGTEWRIHYHVPLHSAPAALWETTADHLLGVLDLVGSGDVDCAHLEMETYTWEVLPPELRSRDVVDQLVAEYHWVLAELRRRRLA